MTRKVNRLKITIWHVLDEQGVALTGRNRTGPPCSVGRPTAYAPGPAAADRSRARRPVHPPSVLQTTTDDDDRQQTPASKTILAN